MNTDERNTMLRDVFVNGLRLLVFHPEKIMEDITAGVQQGAQSFAAKVDDALVTMRDYRQLKGCWRERAADQPPNETLPSDTTEPPTPA